MKKKKGISLIVLIITIIVIIILAAAIILTITKNNPMSSAKEATFKTDIRNFQDSLAMYVGKQLVTDYYGNREKLSVIDNLGDMDKYITGYNKKKYSDKLGIESDELVYFPDKVTKDEKKWLDDLGIKPYGDSVKVASEDIFIWDENDTNKIIGYNKDLFEQYILDNNNILKFPDRCVTLGDGAFLNCTLIENLVMNNNITKIERGCFNLCSNLKSVKFSDNITYIGRSAFSSCENLKSIKLPKELKIIDERAFTNCKSIVNIEFPQELEKINFGAFESCHGLTELIIPNSVNYLGSRVFSSCLNLSKIKLSDNISALNSSLFSYCGNLKQVELPKNLEGIYYEAFYGCNLESIDIPEGTKEIGTWVFESCDNLKSVNLPSTISKIDCTAFDKCQSLKEINVSNSNSYYTSEDGILFNKDKTKIIRYPAGLENEEYVIPDSVKIVGENAFSYSKYLKNITSMSGVNKLCGYSFEYCENLNNIVLSDNLNTIEYYSFSGCKNLKKIILPSSLTIIGERAFQDCYNLKYIYCRASKASDGWDNNWKLYCYANVIWGYTGD